MPVRVPEVWHAKLFHTDRHAVNGMAYKDVPWDMYMRQLSALDNSPKFIEEMKRKRPGSGGLTWKFDVEQRYTLIFQL